MNVDLATWETEAGGLLEPNQDNIVRFCDSVSEMKQNSNTT